MVDGWRLVIFIFFLAHAKIWSNFRVVKLPVFETSIIECSGNANGANGIQTVGVLNDVQFDRRECLFSISAFKRDVFYNLDDVLNCCFVNIFAFKKFARYFWANSFVSVVKFTVGNVVK